MSANFLAASTTTCGADLFTTGGTMQCIIKKTYHLREFVLCILTSSRLRCALLWLLPPVRDGTFTGQCGQVLESIVVWEGGRVKNEFFFDPQGSQMRSRGGLGDSMGRGYPGIYRGYQRDTWRDPVGDPGSSWRVPRSASEEAGQRCSHTNSPINHLRGN